MLGLRVLTAMLLGRSSWNHEPITKYNMLGILEFVCTKIRLFLKVAYIKENKIRAVERGYLPPIDFVNSVLAKYDEMPLTFEGINV